MVSVIVPVFNTEKYLDECIKSIVKQSYTDIECILINDGSEDGSLDICQKWKREDSRIVLIDKKNEGQGKARDLGIQTARGKYILFVDSDDYLEEGAIEKIFQKMEREQSDICIFSYYAHGTEGSLLVHPLVLIKNSHSVSECENLLCQMNPMLCNKMYLAELLKNAEYPMENTICEDLFFLPQLYVKAGRISTLEDACYHYRMTREGNLSTEYNRYPEVKKNVEKLVNQFCNNNLFVQYWKELFCISFDIFKDILFRIAGKRKDFPRCENIQKLYPEYLKNYEKFLSENFGELMESRLLRSDFFVIGSYNLRIIVRSLLLEETHLSAYYGASCIESIMSDKEEWQPEYVNSPENEYREKQIIQDVKGMLLYDRSVYDCDYIVIDLLEQVNSLMEVGEGYITVSEFSENRIKINEEKVISFEDGRRTALFQKYLPQYIRFLRKTKKPVILIENYLSEKFSTYYDVMEKYDIYKINTANKLLRWEYELFQLYMPEVIFVSTDEIASLRFTQKDFYFGCKPEYYNSGYYRYCAFLMGQKVKEINEQKENMEKYL